MAKIDALGGSVSAIEQGYIQDQIGQSAYEYQRQIESGEKIIVGVNKFQTKETGKIKPFKIDDSIGKVQSDKLVELRAKRDNVKAKDCLNAIKAAAENNTNLMPVVIAAVENYCTLGEIADELRKVFGEFK
jgi:methylmalonyl-CoA mutase N-terminal domain/subunit